MAIVRIGTTNALPVTTSIIFGRYNSTGNSGALDLYGYQPNRAIDRHHAQRGRRTTNDYCGGITNFNPATGRNPHALERPERDRTPLWQHEPH